MSLAVYVHVPYCLQRCRYCDFTTFEFSEILPPDKYIGLMTQEIRRRRELWPQTTIKTLYFGGGTPSLIDPSHIVTVCHELANAGLKILPAAEVTIEINPATIDEAKLNTYLQAGFNRFSVGAQTFNDRLLKLCNRRHSAEDTRETLRLLQKYGVNYSFDLLFALPTQTLGEVREDLQFVRDFSPPHLSAYCLTVPEGHPMSHGRAPEGEQLEMFACIEQSLAEAGLEKYEISNFAKPGFESRHNNIYWNNESYWGIGLSSHSYARESGQYGQRFWNPKSLSVYAGQVTASAPSYRELLPIEQLETLALHESLTDFFHIRLRTMAGLHEDALHKMFPVAWTQVAEARLLRLGERGLIEKVNGAWRLTRDGQLISNKVFEELCFLPNDRAPETLTRKGGDSYCAV